MLRVLTVNGGSSSLKLRLLVPGDELLVGEELPAERRVRPARARAVRARPAGRRAMRIAAVLLDLDAVGASPSASTGRAGA